MRILQAHTLVLFTLWGANPAFAETTLVRANVYNVPDSVAFSIDNYGASDFVFDWQNLSPGGPGTGITTVGIPDPTLILYVGTTYTFQRMTSAHPFIILNLGSGGFFTGTDGNFSRTTSDTSSLSVQFTASPGSTDYYGYPIPGNMVTWTPTTPGDYFYTCAVGSHQSMAGLITVSNVPEPSTLSFSAIILTIAAFYRRIFGVKKAKSVSR